MNKFNYFKNKRKKENSLIHESSLSTKEKNFKLEMIRWKHSNPMSKVPKNCGAIKTYCLSCRNKFEINPGDKIVKFCAGCIENPTIVKVTPIQLSINSSS